MAAADPKSKNQTEQLLAEPEVQRFFATLATVESETLLPDPADAKDDNYCRNSAGRDGFRQDRPTHPGAVFATEIKKDKGGAAFLKKNIRGGMLVAAGQDADKLRAAFEELHKQAVAVDRRNFCLRRSKSRAARGIVSRTITGGHQSPLPADSRAPTSSSGSATAASRRSSNAAGRNRPRGSSMLRKQLPVERVSMVVHLNLKMLLDEMAANNATPKPATALRRLGLDKLSAVSSVSGLEGETFTSKLLLATDGEPQGPLLSLFSDQPLRAEDLKPIPRDATLGFAMRFDAQKAVEQFAALVQKSEPAQRAAIEGPWDALTKSLSVDLRRDLPKALGDTCCVYTSPGEGGLISWASRPSCRSRIATRSP